MQAQDIVEHLKTQSGKNVVVRVAGKEHAIRGIYEVEAAVVIEAGEMTATEAFPTDTPSGLGEVPGGPEGEGVEPPPPGQPQRP